MFTEIQLFTELQYIITFMIEAFIHIWPYLLITIPLAVAIQMSGASKYINKAFSASPIVAIFLATAVGAFSPFCSCSVIPVVASMLISGVPLAPVMAFWIASPSMDPEVFFLSVGLIGWELAVWRLGATFVLSLSAGLITHVVMQRGWLGDKILKQQDVPASRNTWQILQTGWQQLHQMVTRLATRLITPAIPATSSATNATSHALNLVEEWHPTSASSTTVSIPLTNATATSTGCGCQNVATATSCGSSSTPNSVLGVDKSKSTGCGSSCAAPASFRKRLFNQTWDTTGMIIKFMLLAFFLEALIIRYIPAAWIAGLLGQDNSYSIFLAALIGIPVYTTEIAALPMVSGLMQQGMSPAAVLTFLIAGPTTTLPAMAAVWGITTRRVFLLYLSFSLVGSIVVGYIYTLVSLII